MQSDPNAHSSDLELARALSRRLRSRAPHAAEAAPLPSPPAAPPVAPARLEPAEKRAGASAAPIAATPVDAHTSVADAELPVAEIVSRREHHIDPSAWQSETLGSRVFCELLTEVLEIAKAERATSAFAVDEQGLLIAAAGSAEDAILEATGSRVVIAVEQAARMEAFGGERPRALQIEIGGQWLTALPIDGGATPGLVVCVIASRPLADDARGVVAGLITEVVMR